MIHFIIFFFLLSLGLVCSAFTDSFTCQIKLLIFYLSFFKCRCLLLETLESGHMAAAGSAVQSIIGWPVTKV